ncbi:MAG: polymer-forming cytoskeletal protein [Rickettsiales bacterium]|nr:polymer-forming cytoskeletal protein [Rickettsiales bacterium]
MSISKVISSSTKSNKGLLSSKPQTPKSTPTIISRDVVMEGDIKSTGLIEIEGKFNGTINGNFIVIRESGFVDGTISAESLVVKGEVTGNINAKSINIANKAKINGNIDYGTLSVEDGACIDGNFKRISKES